MRRIPVTMAKPLEELPAAALLFQMLTGEWLSRAIAAAARLGLADAMSHGEKSVEALAGETGTNPEALYRLLRALASAGVFRETPRGGFTLMPLGECLKSDSPGSMREMAVMFGEEWHWKPWGHFLESLKTGKDAFSFLYGKTMFDYFSENSQAAAIFNGAMTNGTGTEIEAILNTYDFSQVKTVVDIAGGHGLFLTAVLKRHPGVNAVLLDVPHVVEGARNRLRQEGLLDRVKLVPGNFFSGIPADGDLYFLKHILHDWNDDQAGLILKNCRKAMKPEAKVLVAEILLPSGNIPSWGKFLDLEMLVISPGGRERTEQEFRRIFQAAGLRLARVFRPESHVCLLEGKPA